MRGSQRVTALGVVEPADVGGVAARRRPERHGPAELGFRLYLPEDWCADPERCRGARIPESVEFQTKPALGGELVARAARTGRSGAPRCSATKPTVTTAADTRMPPASL